VREANADFAELNIDALLITGAENVRYLTGYTGSNGLLLLTRQGPIFFTDPRYEIQSAKEVSCRIVVVRQGPLIRAAAVMIQKKRLKRVGFERAHLSYDTYLFLDESIGDAQLVGIGPLVEYQRMVKTDDELALIRQSVNTNSAAFARVAKSIRVGMSERDVAAEIDYQMRRSGAEKPAFDTIVAAGENSALPHARPGSRKLAGDELLLIDMGTFQEGYASDMTRMLHLGPVAAKTRRMYNAVLEAQLAAIDTVREGVAAARVDHAARSVLASYKLDKTFTHSTGHGLGLEIHEPPRLGKRDKTRLQAGMAITIEPGAYIENFGGIRIEDTIVVTRNGCEVLTPTPKELITL
jgi:Xaa-Pro aminopeptidase